MVFFRNIALTLAFLLMLVGNTTAVDVCLTEGKFALSGTQTCAATSESSCCHVHANLSIESNTSCESGHVPQTPHEQITIVLDDDLASGKTSTTVPVPTVLFLPFFPDSAPEKNLFPIPEKSPSPPPDFRQLLLQSLSVAGIVPLLA